MTLEGIISIAGRPGLFKVITKGKNSVIVESLIDKKRFAALSSEKISALEDISIFTSEEDVKLIDVLSNLYKISSGKEGPSHKADEKTLRASFEKTLPNYDKDRVYFSDIKKFFQWYNMLLAEGLLIMEVEVNDVTEKGKADKTEKAETKTPKKASAKKTNVPTAGTPPVKSMKAGAVKKVATVKTGGGRGK
jgi:hypothetical protein